MQRAQKLVRGVLMLVPWLAGSVALSGVALGGGERGAARVTQRIAVDRGLAVSGFAIPVGVPVAAVAGPLVVYSYRDAAGVATRPSERPVACGCGCCGGGRAEIDTVGSLAVNGEEPAGAAVLRQRCARCHGGSGAQGGVRLFSEQGTWEPGWRAKRKAVFSAIRDGVMPKGGPALGDEEFTSVVEFLLEDEPPIASCEAETGAASEAREAGR